MTLRRLIVALLLIVGVMGVAASAEAQEGCHGRGLLLTCGGPALAYTPPLDVVRNASAAYGLRLLRRAYTGPAINCRRVSDNAQKDIGFTRRGDLDVATLTAWLAGSTCAVTKWYDQSGSGRDVSQATAASQPAIALNAQNGLAVLRPAGSQVLSTAAALTLSQPFTFIFAGKRTGNLTTYSPVLYVDVASTPNSTQAGLGFNSTVNTGIMASHAAGSIADTFPLTDSAWHDVIGSFNGASSAVRVNGSVTGFADAGSGGTAEPLFVLGSSFGGLVIGDIGEIYVYPRGLSTADQAALEASIRAYYGF